jgi:hypothetical protein
MVMEGRLCLLGPYDFIPSKSEVMVMPAWLALLKIKYTLCAALGWGCR